MIWHSFCYGIQPQDCHCGSGKEMFRCDDYDGDFVAHVCDDCEVETLSKFNPDIWKKSYEEIDYEF